MFQFRRFPTYAYLIQRRLTEYCSAGLPHSVISGSKPICGSPKLIAACHDLHRLLMPRHSPCALYSLTSRRVSAPLWFSELCRPLRSFQFGELLYPFPERLPAIRFKVFHNLLALQRSLFRAHASLCCLLFIILSIFVVQFSRCRPSSLVQGQIETLDPSNASIQS